MSDTVDAELQAIVGPGECQLIDKASFVKALAAQAECSEMRAEKVLNASLKLIASCLINGDTVRLKGFGSFSTTVHRARVGRNVHTGERVTVPARRVAQFKPSVSLRAELAKQDH